MFGNPYQQRIQKEMVEVAGIEPASESILIQATTCLAQALILHLWQLSCARSTLGYLRLNLVFLLLRRREKHSPLIDALLTRRAAG